ncbi:hypothetical protein FXW78_48955 [Rhodococcus opacus]|nr:hypothetical protein [Rhodococcus opacus]RZL79601.1 MAG: hypothetical protein EOP32_19040 [Rhodococcus sp. (in: high G+C Gram-positive bacteria)]
MRREQLLDEQARTRLICERVPIGCHSTVAILLQDEVSRQTAARRAKYARRRRRRLDEALAFMRRRARFRQHHRPETPAPTRSVVFLRVR